MSAAKTQFNVYLDADLVQAVKRASVDRRQTLSEFVSEALRAHIRVPPNLEQSTVTGITPLPILFARDVPASVSLCRALGLRVTSRSRNGRWAELTAANGAVVGVHAVEAGDEARVQLDFESHVPLEDVLARLEASGVSTDGPMDEGYGRSLRARGPDGLSIQINEIHADLFV